MSSSFKMGGLSVLIFYFALLKACFALEFTTVASELVGEKIPCPGHCAEEHLCSTIMRDSDCSDGLECCVEDDVMDTTEYADYLTTESGFGYSSPSEDSYEVEAEAETEDDQTIHYSFPGVDAENSDYTYVLSDESDTLSFRRSGDVEGTCAGICVPLEASSECDYVLSEEGACPEETTCCLSEDVIHATSDAYNYFIAEESSDDKLKSGVLKRTVSSPSNDPCPGTCVHPSHALFCEKILSQYFCPLDSKCCIKRSSEPSTKVLQCTGQCLPAKMQGYCFPPNELILGSTSCKSGTTCCMQRSDFGSVQPPSIGAMGFPDEEYRSPSQVVMGHLAIDEEGTVFRVDTNGQISSLPRISRIDHLRATYNKLMVHPFSGGHIVIYSDSTGALYQQFYPNMTYDPETPFGRKPDYQPNVQKGHVKKPVIKRPVEDETSLQDFELVPEFEAEQSAAKPTHNEKESSSQELGHLSQDEQEDIIIPESDDEALIVESKPSVADSQTGRTTCPGSCVPHSLRFTCFRGHSIYDGFSCPNRLVCCAKEADIENHETLLRSLSPYYKESSDSDKTTQTCGIRGRKDSQPAVNGKESLPGDWCWQVAIINVQNQYMCGGALIGESLVLTAAHCVSSSLKDNQAIFVRVGVTDLKSPDDNINGQTIRVVTTLMHHNYNGQNLDNNIALLKLQRSVVLGSNVCVVCLPISGHMPAEHAKCTVTGYGFVVKEGEMALKIREAQVPIIDDTECMANVTDALVNPFLLPASSFCAGGEGQQDACQGDAGGPLTCEISGHHELVGLVSWTLGCGRSDVPSIYVKVPAFMGWINEVVSSRTFLTSLN